MSGFYTNISTPTHAFGYIQEILYGRDLDVQPREDDFRDLRAWRIKASDKALICASLQATAVARRCVAAGLQAAELKLAELRKCTKKRSHSELQTPLLTLPTPP